MVPSLSRERIHISINPCVLCVCLVVLVQVERQARFPLFWPYVDLVVAEALLHLVEQAAVRQLTEGRQVVIGSRRHQLHLSDTQDDGLNMQAVKCAISVSFLFSLRIFEGYWPKTYSIFFFSLVQF